MTSQKDTVPAERTIAVAFFPYRAKVVAGGVEKWLHKYATRGETITLHDQADLDKGENNDHFVKPGQAVPGSPAALSLDELGLMTDDQLADLWADKPPAVKDLLTAVGDDPELAQRVLDVENTTGEPRKSLVEGLEKITGAGD